MYNVGNGGATLEERVLAIRDVFCGEKNQKLFIILKKLIAHNMFRY